MFKVGDKVIFGRTHGEQTHGTVVKVNRTTVLVAQDEERGVYRTRSVGTKWKVPFSLCRLAGAAAVSAPAVVAPKAKRSDDAIMRDISNCYGMLSPENLTCDGELRGSALITKARRIRAKLADLQTELGRRVTEDQCWMWERNNPRRHDAFAEAGFGFWK